MLHHKKAFSKNVTPEVGSAQFYQTSLYARPVLFAATHCGNDLSSQIKPLCHSKFLTSTCSSFHFVMSVITAAVSLSNFFGQRKRNTNLHFYLICFDLCWLRLCGRRTAPSRLQRGLPNDVRNISTLLINPAVCITPRLPAYYVVRPLAELHL